MAAPSPTPCPFCSVPNTPGSPVCRGCGQDLLPRSAAVPGPAASLHFPCPNCGQPFAQGASLCPNCGARLNRRSVVALCGIGLILSGVAAGMAGALLGALGMVQGMISDCSQCLARNNPTTESQAHAESAKAAVAASGILLLGGFELALLGILFCVLRPWRLTGPNTMRNTAITSLSMAVIGLGLWIAVAAGAPLGAPRWLEPGAAPPARVVYILLVLAVVAASITQLAAAAGLLRGWPPGEVWLYRATLGKFATYTAIWLLLPVLASKFGGAAVYDSGYWLFTTGVVIVYYWMVLRLGFLRHPPSTGAPSGGAGL